MTLAGNACLGPKVVVATSLLSPGSAPWSRHTFCFWRVRVCLGLQGRHSRVRASVSSGRNATKHNRNEHNRCLNTESSPAGASRSESWGPMAHNPVVRIRLDYALVIASRRPQRHVGGPHGQGKIPRGQVEFPTSLMLVG